ncbi:MAG: YciI family protein [Phycisphaerales bacterium]
MQQFICFLTPTREGMPDDPTPEESAAAIAHFEYYKELHSKGTLILAGRTQTTPHTGILIFEAEHESAAHEIVNLDPAVIAGVFQARVQPYQVALMRY